VRILLIAEGAAGVQVLRLLAGTAHHIVAVMTRDAGAAPVGATVTGVASRLGYPVWPARRAEEREFPRVLMASDLDLILNIARLCWPERTQLGHLPWSASPWSNPALDGGGNRFRTHCLLIGISDR
jgi:hypothetical protein